MSTAILTYEGQIYHGNAYPDSSFHIHAIIAHDLTVIPHDLKLDRTHNLLLRKKVQVAAVYMQSSREREVEAI